MAHMLLIEDIDGDVEDGHYVCSDSCHRTLANTLEVAYKGWLGCIELEFVLSARVAVTSCTGLTATAVMT